MAARIFRFSDHAAVARLKARAVHSTDMLGKAGDAANAAEPSERYCLWLGASGEKYVHSVYSLLNCPEISAANYVLVRRDPSGNIAGCCVGRVDKDAPSLNLAEIRHKGALFGATEVHIHLLAATAKRAKLIAFDIESGHVGVCPDSDARH